MLDKSSAWVVGLAGLARFPIDGGIRWQFQYTPTESDLLDVEARDHDHAWAVGEGGVVIRYNRL